MSLVYKKHSLTYHSVLGKGIETVRRGKQKDESPAIQNARLYLVDGIEFNVRILSLSNLQSCVL